MTHYEDEEEYDRSPIRTRRFLVAVYMVDRSFGGPEEGGWWYDTGDLIRLIRMYRNEDDAIQFANRMQRMIDATLNRGRHDISSVLSEGQYRVEVHDNSAPLHYPESRPYYS